jgi:hypothetical protein
MPGHGYRASPQSQTVLIHSTRVGTLPRVEAPDQLEEAPDQLGEATPEDGLVTRVRANPWLTVAIAAGAILVLAWIGWAIYVAGDRGAKEGLGVLIAWPALIAAAALISLPFIGGFLLVRRLRVDTDSSAATGDPES